MEATGETGQRGVDLSNGDTRYTLDTLNEQKRSTAQAYTGTILNRDTAGNVTSAVTNAYTGTADLEQDPFPAPTSTLRSTSYSYGTGGLITGMVPPECGKLAVASLEGLVPDGDRAAAAERDLGGKVPPKQGMSLQHRDLPPDQTLHPPEVR